MRKITWLILLFIVITWLAISAYWTGNESSKESTSQDKIVSSPAPEPIITISLPEASPSSSITLVPDSTPSATPTLKSSKKPTITTTPEPTTVSRLKF